MVEVSMSALPPVSSTHGAVGQSLLPSTVALIPPCLWSLASDCYGADCQSRQFWYALLQFSRQRALGKPNRSLFDYILPDHGDHLYLFIMARVMAFGGALKSALLQTNLPLVHCFCAACTGLPSLLNFFPDGLCPCTFSVHTPIVLGPEGC